MQLTKTEKAKRFEEKTSHSRSLLGFFMFFVATWNCSKHDLGKSEEAFSLQRRQEIGKGRNRAVGLQNQNRGPIFLRALVPLLTAKGSKKKGAVPVQVGLGENRQKGS